MDAPKCKICKARHYGPCETYGVSPAMAILPVIQGHNRKRKAELIEAQAFDRITYQRDYMRKRRAKAKALEWVIPK